MFFSYWSYTNNEEDTYALVFVTSIKKECCVFFLVGLSVCVPACVSINTVIKNVMDYHLDPKFFLIFILGDPG